MTDSASGSSSGTSAAKYAPVGGRRRLIVMFADLCDSTLLSRAMEPEDYADLIASLRLIYRGIVEKHGGTMVRAQGDGMLAVFGHPRPREGDITRAVTAALELHAAVRSLPPPPAVLPSGLRLHSGVHSGQVHVAPGDEMLGSLDLNGLVPNIASKLSTRAGRDEILASVESLGPEIARFETGASRQVEVDSSDDIVEALPIFGRRSTVDTVDVRTRRSLRTFIGRAAELRRLEKHLGRMLDGAAIQLAITGPPGVGKTRLAEELMFRAERGECCVLRGYCSEDSGSEALQPLRQMLRQLLALPPASSPTDTRLALRQLIDAFALHDLQSALQQLLGVAVTDAGLEPPRVQVEDTVAALVALFEAQAARRPLVLFIDDLQWSDAATRQTISALGLVHPHVPTFVLVTARNVEATDMMLRTMDVVELPPFSASEASESVRALLPQANPFTAAEICRYSGGNPLYIEELCHRAAHEDIEAWSAREHRGSAWLDALVETRVARLPVAQAELLRVASVVGTTVPTWLLRELTGCDEDDPTITALAERDFLFPDTLGILRFKHGLTRDVVYKSVASGTRRALHLRTAEALAQHAEPGHELPHEALAYHFEAAERPVEAADHAERAGNRAAAISILDRAKAMYHQALAQLQAADREGAQAARWLSIANRLGMICVFDAARRDLPIFERAVELARRSENPEDLARAKYWLGYITYALGESRAAIAHCEEGLAMAGAWDGPLAVQIRATLGQVNAAACDYDRAQPLLEEAVDIKRSHHDRHRKGRRERSGVSVGLAYSLATLGAVVGDRGEFARAYALLDEAWGLLNGATHEIGSTIIGWRSVILNWQGRWDEARVAATEATRIAEETRSLFQFCIARSEATYAEWKLTGDRKFVHEAEQATKWLEPRESGLFRSLNHGWLADCWLACGERDKGRSHAARALRRGRTGDLLGAAMAYRALALDAARSNDEPRADHWLRRAFEVARRRRSRHEAASCDLCGAEIARLFGRPADLLLSRALEAFTDLEMPWHEARARQLSDALAMSADDLDLPR